MLDAVERRRIDLRGGVLVLLHDERIDYLRLLLKLRTDERSRTTNGIQGPAIRFLGIQSRIGVKAVLVGLEVFLPLLMILLALSHAGLGVRVVGGDGLLADVKLTVTLLVLRHLLSVSRVHCPLLHLQVRVGVIRFESVGDYEVILLVLLSLGLLHHPYQFHVPLLLLQLKLLSLDLPLSGPALLGHAEGSRDWTVCDVDRHYAYPLHIWIIFWIEPTFGSEQPDHWTEMYPHLLGSVDCEAQGVFGVLGVGGGWLGIGGGGVFGVFGVGGVLGVGGVFGVGVLGVFGTGGCSCGICPCWGAWIAVLEPRAPPPPPDDPPLVFKWLMLPCVLVIVVFFVGVFAA